jgi:hypothetical protein
MRMKPKPPLESVIQAKILDWLKAQGYFCWRSNNAPIFDPKRKAFRAAGKYAPKGLPDICGILQRTDGTYQGRAFFIEVKRPGGKLRPDQAAFMDQANELGALAFMATSLDEVQFVFGGKL